MVLAGLAPTPPTRAAPPHTDWPRFATAPWPEGTDTLRFENLEGLIVVRATASGPNGRDTSGSFVLDTGAGFLALDRTLAVALGVADSGGRRSVDVAPRALARLETGSFSRQLVAPVMVFESGLLSRATDRAILGLLGYRVIGDRVLWLDYREGRLALVPAGADVEREDIAAVAESRRLLRGLISAAAIPARCRMSGDGKMLVQVRVTPARGGGPTPWLTMVLDTGASKCLLFEDVVEPLASTAGWKPALRGLVAPTLAGVSRARLVRARRVELRGAAGTAEALRVDVALIRNPLARELERLAGEPVHGLLGYSFLRRFRLACDYPRRVVWLDPIPDYRDDRPDEHAHVGIQLEHDQGRVRVVAVAEDSPAARAGIQAGDQLVTVNNAPVSGLGSIELGRRMEGRPGSLVVLTFRRGEIERTYRLRRRRLL